MEKLKICVNIEELKDYYRVYYLIAKNEEEYNNGNHDFFYKQTIDKKFIENEEELFEEIKFYAPYGYTNSRDDVEICEYEKLF